MKDLVKYIKESKEDTKIRSKIIFTIWEAPSKKVSELKTNDSYQKIECKYKENEDEIGLMVSFLLGYKDNSWQLWAGKPGVVTYLDDSYANLEETDFYKAINKAIDKCVELIKEIKKEPNKWVQYYIENI